VRPQDGFPRWLRIESMKATGMTTDADGRKWGGFDLVVSLRWYRFFFPSYWQSPRFRFR
jgi:hypothetical protein